MTTETPGSKGGLPEMLTRRSLIDLAAPESETVIHNRGDIKEMVEKALDADSDKFDELKCSELASTIMDILSLNDDRKASLDTEKQAVCDWVNQYARSLVAGRVFERRGEIIVTGTQLKTALAKLPPEEIKKIEEATEMIFPKLIPQPESR